MKFPSESTVSEIAVTRKQLYDLVWSEPIRKLARKLRVTVVSLRRTCLHMEVPVPSQDRWKPGYDLPPKIVQLNLDYIGNNYVTFSVANAEEIIVSINTEEEPLDLREFDVPNRLINPDKLIVHAESILKSEARYDNWDPILHCWEGLSIRVSKTAVDRALCFMDRLVKSLKARGYIISPGRYTYVKLGAESVEIILREQTERSYEDTDYGSRRQRFIPTGRLYFRMGGSWGKQWTDGRILLEARLEEIVQGLVQRLENDRLATIRRNERQRAEEEKKRLEAERQMHEEAELSKFNSLLHEAKRWREVALLRGYVTDRLRIAEQTGSMTNELIDWLDWAQKKIDWYDPSVNRKDEILAVVDKYNAVSREESKEYSVNTSKRDDYAKSYFQKSFWKV